MTVPKIGRVLGVLLMVVGVLAFTTVVVSHWHNETWPHDSRCPYCHQGHQTAVQPEIAQGPGLLLLVASLPLLEDIVPATNLVLSQAAPRAPPSA
jgi:hypothetical protein